MDSRIREHDKQPTQSYTSGWRLMELSQSQKTSLDLANTSLLKPISAQLASVQDRVLSDEATLIFLRCYLTLATVAARIIAGRKLRWHRDKLLMQKMSISAAGGKGGMKLAGVDKQQSAHEDREAAEVVDVWKKQVGRLRSAVAAAAIRSSLACPTYAAKHWKMKGSKEQEYYPPVADCIRRFDHILRSPIIYK
ncbi:hypothetical protein QBC46DRAFT_414859 [Diplogelasinospora grovesii]|uniref:Uncharacterized protein n=1 Tax=Diplogelasinospora grovesii TaxID=303347 RepID=A0AAN6SA42_9PEZI|nr:hypothetical protein QBC46DRAFT_414859 [Diplogelasinospora grovesii]